jgi:hypothetical protein
VVEFAHIFIGSLVTSFVKNAACAACESYLFMDLMTSRRKPLITMLLLYCQNEWYLRLLSHADQFKHLSGQFSPPSPPSDQIHTVLAAIEVMLGLESMSKHFYEHWTLRCMSWPMRHMNRTCWTCQYDIPSLLDSYAGHVSNSTPHQSGFPLLTFECEGSPNEASSSAMEKLLGKELDRNNNMMKQLTYTAPSIFPSDS